MELTEGSPLNLAMYSAWDSLFATTQTPATYEGWSQRGEQLRERWNKVVAGLRLLGWSPGAVVDFLNDCPQPRPTAVKSKTSIRSCQRYAICPYCWARKVAGDCFKRLAYVWFGEYGRWDPRRAWHKRIRGYLVHMTSYTYVPVDRPLAEIIPKMLAKQQVFKQRFKEAHGAFVLTTIDTCRRDWRIVRRMLAVVHESHPQQEIVPEPSPELTTEVYTGRVNPYRLAEIVGRACLYPEYLLNVPVDHTYEILQARAGSLGKQPRMMSYYGLLRNREHRKQLSSLRRPAG